MIKISSSKQIAALVADLQSDRAVARDAAAARLTVLGARAVESLIALVESSAASAVARAQALRTLAAIGDPHARRTILRAIDDADATVAMVAVSAARGYLRGPHGADALDRLARVALDRSREAAVRVAAVRAVRSLGASTVGPLLKSLEHDPDEAIRESAQSRRDERGKEGADPAKTIAAAAAGRLPADPDDLRHAITSGGSASPLPDLLRVIEAVRDREGQESAGRRDRWRAARAAAHLSLARRGSRIAVYDLRESLESRGEAALPVEFLAALSAVGDASCLDAIAAAHARARDRWWRDHLAATFRAIVSREGLTRHHAVIKRIEKRWPGISRSR